MIDDTLLEAEEKMDKAVAVARDELGTLRTGRASPQMFARLHIDYYGTPTPIPQMASITVTEARMAVIKPYDLMAERMAPMAIEAAGVVLVKSPRGNAHPAASIRPAA